MFQKILQSRILKKGFKEIVKFFFDYRSINTNEILDVHKYVMKEVGFF